MDKEYIALLDKLFHRIRHRFILVILTTALLLLASQFHLPKTQAYNAVQPIKPLNNKHSKQFKIAKPDNLSNYWFKVIKHNQEVKLKALRDAKEARKAHLEHLRELAAQKRAFVRPRQVTPVVKRTVVYKVTYGNHYPVGQCTQYVKSRRPDIPDYLGDANLWFNELKSRGFAVGYTPRVGAIGQSKYGNHVVYIERVNKDGTVYLSERNYDWHGSFRYRIAPASNFRYIYK